LRFLVLIGILAGLASPANAVEKVTVAQVEQALAEHALKAQAAKSHIESPSDVAEIADSDLLPGVDDSVLSRLSALDLTERMSTLTLYRLIGEYRLDAHAQMVLQQMADRQPFRTLHFTTKKCRLLKKANYQHSIHIQCLLQ